MNDPFKNSHNSPAPERHQPSASRRALFAMVATTPLLGAVRTEPAQAGAIKSGGDLEFVTPEQFGASGDGRADDSAAVQQAIDAVASRGGGVVALQPATAYRFTKGIELDISRVSVWGNGLMDFSGCKGSYFRITASNTAPRGVPNNNYGHKAVLSGAINIIGAGSDTNSVGLDLQSDIPATAAQALFENVSISSCGVGIRFGDRAYNNCFIKCEIFNCDVCVLWPRAQDNGERNTLIGCTIFNSGTAVHITNPNASVQLTNCSIDYTEILYDVEAGSVLADSCHHESNKWDDAPVRCRGDGAFVRMNGGWIVNQNKHWHARNFVSVAKGASVHLESMIVNTITLSSPDKDAVASWSSGEGEYLMRHTRSFEFSALPLRVNTSSTSLADPDFSAPNWQDPIWRRRDTVSPIVDCYGNALDNLSLAKTRWAGQTFLAAKKRQGSGTPAQFILMALPVAYGEQVLAGFRTRRSPDRSGQNGTMDVLPSWCRIDGHDEHHVPVIAKLEPVGTKTVTVPTDDFVMVAPLAARSQRSAPRWATHFCMVVDLSRAAGATFLFDGLWCDTI